MTEQKDTTPDNLSLGPFTLPFKSEHLWWVAVVITLIWGGVWFYNRLNHVILDDARLTADIIVVSSAVDSEISQILVSSGQVVPKNTALLLLDDRKAKLNIQEQEAGLNALGYHLEALIVQRGVAEESSRLDIVRINSSIAKQQADFNAQQAAFKKEKAILSKLSELAKKDLLSKLDLEVQTQVVAQQQWKLNAEKQAAKELGAALLIAKNSQDTLLALDASIERAKQEIKAKKATLDQAIVRLGEHQIRTSSQMVIDSVFVDIAERTQRGRPLIAMHDPSKVWVTANVPETDIKHFYVGQKAEITIDAYNDRTYIATVEKIKAVANNQLSIIPNTNPSGNYVRISQRVHIKLTFDEKPDAEKLIPGLLVRVEITK